jgi:hypothetical protein
MAKTHRGWKPSLWASKKTFGIGEKHPNNYMELVRALRENRDQLGYAWRILNHGVCDGCSLGTKGCATGHYPRSIFATSGCGCCG